MRTPLLLTVLSATLVFAGCGGGGGSSAVPSTGGGSNSGASSQSVSENAITAANSLGSPVKTLTNYNGAISGASAGRIAATMSTSSSCANNREFFAPDKNGDANSTEVQYFYDSACTQLARDTVRLYTITGNSETVNRTEKIYAINNTTPSAVRSDATTIRNATFDANGYPIVANGFQRSNSGYLDLAGSRTIDSDEELVMQPGSNGVNSFCSDSAGFNATGIASLNETFGWQGGVSGGTRTVNSDGSVTWSATHAGNTYKGAIGSLSINVAAANTGCPITAPEYTIAGGTQGNAYSIPVTVTYKSGMLQNLTVTNATLPNGNTLNVTTNSNVAPTSNGFITGIVSSNGSQFATFSVDAFGDGTLTVTSSGAQYVITDWHVVK